MSGIKPTFGIILAFLVTALIVGCYSTSTTQNNSNDTQASRTTLGNSNANKVSPAASPAAAPASGEIDITSTPPGATVVLIREDEGGSGEPQRKGSTPVTITGVVPGKYSINLEKPGFKYFQKEVELKENKTVKIAAALKRG